MMLDGKIALVTGARSGIGRAIAARFLKEGATVYAADLTPEGSLGPPDEGSRFVKLDVTQEADAIAAMDQVREAHGKLDIPVNAAGIGKPGGEHGTKFEFECYDLGHLYNVEWFVDQGLITPPLLIQLGFGIPGGVGADADHLTHMHNSADKPFGAGTYEWPVLAAGRHQIRFATQSAMRGGDLWVGPEDSLFFAGAARTMAGSAAGEYVAGHTSMIRRDPVGRVAAIAPWNYPLMMASWKPAASIAAGCPVVLKPSEITPRSTLRLAALLQDVLPRGAVNVNHGRGPGVGDALINSPGMEAISVTGSPATAMAAMRAASQQIRHVHPELGGKAQVIVFNDADLDAVAETIRYGSYFNVGQDCAQTCRVMVAESVYDKLVAAIADQVGQIRIGAPRAEGTEMSPLVSAAQRDRVAGFVDRARGTAEIVTGGAPGDSAGFFYQPTAIANVDNDADVACSEVFGPVVTLSRFTDSGDALRIANSGAYGLGSSFRTRDAGRAMQMTSRLRYGFTWVITHGVATPGMPWAAMKGSGTGSDMSVYALDAYTAIRHVMVAY